MNKLLIATAILASSTVASTASANMDFTILGGFDSQTGLNIAGEMGFGSALVGLKGLGKREESMMIAKDITQTITQDDLTLYGGYRLDNGLAIKAGVAWTTLDAKITGESGITKTLFRPMVGIGYDVSDNFVVDVHYTMAGELKEHGHKQTIDSGFTIMAGYRF